MDEACVFCRIVKREIEQEFLYQNNAFIVIRDKNPHVEGHLLVISTSHAITLTDISVEDMKLYGDALKRGIEKALKIANATEYNIVSNNGPLAGQVVMHSHTHILPRKKGDGLKLLHYQS